jgi:sugar phosphate isomerase/epimerase
MAECVRPTRRELCGLGLAALGVDAVRAPTWAVRKERAMHLGIVTYNVARDWDLETILRVCREADIEGVEFRTTHAHGIEPGLDAAKRAEVRRRLADSGLKQVSLGSVCEFQSPDLAVVRRNIEECARFVQLARDIGACGVKVRPNGLPKDVPAQKTLEQIGKALAECGRIGAENGVEIWMEVHGGGTMEPPNARRIMEACGSRNVGVTWNSNATDVVNGSVKPSFELLRPFIRCCHITELWSDYPYRELFGLLRKTGYDRFTLCEVGSPIRAEDGVAFLKCYRALWRELGR